VQSSPQYIVHMKSMTYQELSFSPKSPIEGNWSSLDRITRTNKWGRGNGNMWSSPRQTFASLIPVKKLIKKP
jgi:hypothetical protein